MNIKEIIKWDKYRNNHPKNRIFIYIYRIGHYSINRGNRKAILIICRLMARLTYNKYNHIPMECKIGGGVCFPHMLGIVVSGYCEIGCNCTIFHQVTIGVDTIKDCKKAPIVKDNVYIGAGAKLIGNIIIGENSIIGANAVVTKNVPPNSKVVGFNRIIK